MNILANLNSNLDSRDQEILAVAFSSREKIEGPRIGDFVHFPSGELERFSHDWDDGMQTSPGGSFVLGSSGRASLSCGGLNPVTPLNELIPTLALLPGSFWFFHHGVAGAGRGVNFIVPCRVFSTTAAYSGFLGDSYRPSNIKALKLELAAQVSRTTV